MLVKRIHEQHSFVRTISNLLGGLLSVRGGIVLMLHFSLRLDKQSHEADTLYTREKVGGYLRKDVETKVIRG